MTAEMRRARQRTEILDLVDAGERARAEALAREHLLAFPGDYPLFATLLAHDDESTRPA